MSRAIGTNLTEVSRTPSYDPTNGDTVTITYQGTEDGCRAKAADSRAQYYRYTGPRAVGGGLWELQVTVPDSGDGQEATAQEQWEIDSVEEQIEIWRHPDVQEMLASQDDLGASLKAAIIEWAAHNADGQTLASPAFSAGTYEALAVHVCAELIKGGGATPYHRPVLRVRRTYGLQFAERFEMLAKPIAYTSDALRANFSVPAAVMTQMPNLEAVETPPANYVWAWYQSGVTLQTIPATGRIEETRQWTLALVSSILFDIID